MKWKSGSVVFKKDEWVLVQQSSSERGTRRMHRCGNERWTLQVEDLQCVRCGEEIPDEIQGLWMIANWSRLYEQKERG